MSVQLTWPFLFAEYDRSAIVVSTLVLHGHSAAVSQRQPNPHPAQSRSPTDRGSGRVTTHWRINRTDLGSIVRSAHEIGGLRAPAMKFRLSGYEKGTRRVGFDLDSRRMDEEGASALK